MSYINNAISLRYSYFAELLKNRQPRRFRSDGSGSVLVRAREQSSSDRGMYLLGKSLTTM